MRLTVSHPIRVATLSILLCIGIMSLRTGSASAGAIANDVSSVAPTAVANEIENRCVNYGWNVVQLSWVSPQGEPRTTTATVNAGATSVALQLNYVSYRCKANSPANYYTVTGHSKITGTSPSIAALNGNVSDIPYVSISTTGKRSGVVKTFNYSRPGGFNSSMNISITTYSRGVLTQANPTRYKCALVNVSNPNTTGPYNFDPCEQSTSVFTIRVNVNNNKPTIAFDATCSRIAYYVGDADDDLYDVRIIIDGEDKHVEQDQAPNERFESSLTQYKDFGAHQISIRVRSDGGHVITTGEKDIVGSPCATPSCEGVTLQPSSAAAGQSFEVRATFDANIGAEGNGTLYNAVLNLSGPGAITVTPTSGGPGNWIIDVPLRLVGGGIGPGGGGNSETAIWTVQSNTAGNYTGNVVVTGGFNLTCPVGTVEVANHPYLRVWRGDVVAGCTPPSVSPWYPTNTAGSGKIQAWNNDAVGAGAGTDVAAQALGVIDGFSSGQRSTMTVDDYLTFANTGSGWGGSFGSGLCASDYYSGAPATSGSISSANLSSLASGTYSYTGGTISGATIGAGKHLTIYVNGNLTITNDITFGSTTNWSSVTQIPSLKLIVRGDINISNPVNNLSGTYIAQPSGTTTGGTIYTCTNGATPYSDTVSSRTALINNCTDTLTVYGSFVARTVRFLRLSGNVITANKADAVAQGTAAEKFIYSPEIWLSESGSNGTADVYDSITSLPPIF